MGCGEEQTAKSYSNPVGRRVHVVRATATRVQRIRRNELVRRIRRRSYLFNCFSSVGDRVGTACSSDVRSRVAEVDGCRRRQRDAAAGRGRRIARNLAYRSRFPRGYRFSERGSSGRLTSASSGGNRATPANARARRADTPPSRGDYSFLLMEPAEPRN